MAGREYTKMAHNGTDEINAQTMKLLIRDSGLNAPIGASPGELRLWLKKNGFVDALHEVRDGRAAAAKAQPRAPKAAPPPVSAAAPKKTAGRRGGKDGRSGSVEAALKAARAPGQVHDAAAAQHGDALDEFKHEVARKPSVTFAIPQPYNAGGVAGAPPAAVGGVGGAVGSVDAASPASDPAAYARYFQMQVMMQQQALMQQQWQLRMRQASQQQTPLGMPPSYSLGAAAGVGPAAYYNLQPQAYNPQPQAYMPQQYGAA